MTLRGIIMVGLSLSALLSACPGASDADDSDPSPGDDSTVQGDDGNEPAGSDEVPFAQKCPPDASVELPAGPICCTSDSNCPCGAYCVLRRGAYSDYPFERGVCREPLPGDACWFDAECGIGSICAFGLAAETAPDCELPAEEGHCAAESGLGQCCDPVLRACAPGLYCVAETVGNGGVCLPVMPPTRPMLDEKWNDHDCWSDEMWCHPNWRCDHADICGCTTECKSGHVTPGICVPTPAAGCCQIDSDCQGGLTCAIGSVMGHGSPGCLPSPPAGQCRVNGDCPEGQVCRGAHVFGCEGGEPSVMLGTCMEPVAPLQCRCESNAECGADAVCRLPYCVSQNGLDCLEDEDCAAGFVCVGATTTACAVEDYGPAKPGSCVKAGVGTCCRMDSSCGPGLVCAQPRGLNGVAGHGHCAAPIDGHCWDRDECGPNGICPDAVVCTCGETCTEPEKPGTCVPAGSKAGALCADGGVCSEGLECVLKKCLPIPDPGACWQDIDCSGNQFCFGEHVAVWNEYVDNIGKPGECVPYGLAWMEGECCGPGKPCATGSGLVCAFPTTAHHYSGNQYYAVATGTLGRCLELPPVDQCWNDYDCAPKEGIICQGSSLCSCEDEPCTPAPGLCAIAPKN
jgi:hypothetical protein